MRHDGENHDQEPEHTKAGQMLQMASSPVPLVRLLRGSAGEESARWRS